MDDKAGYALGSSISDHDGRTVVGRYISFNELEMRSGFMVWLVSYRVKITGHLPEYLLYQNLLPQI